MEATKTLRTFKKGDLLYTNIGMVEIISSGPKRTRSHRLRLPYDTDQPTGAETRYDYEYDDTDSTDSLFLRTALLVGNAQSGADKGLAVQIMRVLAAMWRKDSFDGCKPYVGSSQRHRDERRVVLALLGRPVPNYLEEDIEIMARNLRAAVEVGRNSIHVGGLTTGSVLENDRALAIINDSRSCGRLKRQAGVDSLFYVNEHGAYKIIWRVDGEG